MLKEVMAREGKMLGGLQLGWLIKQHFKLSKAEGQLLPFRALLKVKLRGDNLQSFQNIWDSTLMSLEDTPPDDILESLYKEQLENSTQFKNTLERYEDDMVHKGIECSYIKLHSMVNAHLNAKRQKRNKKVTELAEGVHAFAGAKGKGKGKGKGKSFKPEVGECRHWCKSGVCPKGDECPYTHPEHKKGSRASKQKPRPKKGPKGKGKEKRGRDSTPSRSRDGSRKKKGEMSDPGSHRGKSPSGKENVKPCKYYLQGKCKNGDKCGLWHPQPCKFYAQGKCVHGKKCVFLHDKKAAPAPETPEKPPKAKAKAKADAKPKAKAKGAAAQKKQKAKKGKAGAAVEEETEAEEEPEDEHEGQYDFEDEEDF